MSHNSGGPWFNPGLKLGSVLALSSNVQELGWGGRGRADWSECLIPSNVQELGWGGWEGRTGVNV